MTSADTLHLHLNGIRIGQLTRRTRGELDFSYCEEWLEHPSRRPVSLSLPLSSRVYHGDKVLNFFDNLLPDNPQIRARLQRRFRLASDRPFDLLASIGRDCVGAIQITEDAVIPPATLDCKPLSTGAIAARLRQYETAPLGMAEDAGDFRISIAGVQEKTALTLYRKKWSQPVGSTPTTHIFKRPIGIIPHSGLDLGSSCENEWLCLELVKAFGLPVPEARICMFEDQKALVVTRFDRQWSADESCIYRLPQEDMCQALGCPPNLKYESDGGPGIREIMQLLLGSREAETDRRNFLKIQVVFWLLAAIDGHAKNFSIFLEAGNRFRLTPFYDILSAYPLLDAGSLQRQKIRMAMALHGKNRHYHWHRLQPDHFLSTAKAAGFSETLMVDIREEVADHVPAVIESVSSRLPEGFPEHIAAAIFAGMRCCRETLTTS